MATIYVENTKLDLNEPTEITFSSATSADTIEFNYDEAGDEKLVMLVKGTATVKLKKGDAIQGVVDIEKAITTEGAIRIDSGLFKNVTGESKGKVVATVSSAASVALIQLP